MQFAASKYGISNSKDRLGRLSQMIGENEIGMLKISSQVFTSSDLNRFLLKKPKKLITDFETDVDLEWLDKVLAIDYKTYQLDDILTKVDRATMSVGLEGCEPLLDYRIVEYVARLDSKLKINNGSKKYILKEVAHKYLPREIMDRPKMGFDVPIFDWFKAELKEYLMYYLGEERLDEAGVFNTKNIIDLRDEYLSGASVNIRQIWLILMFEMWRERWL